MKRYLKKVVWERHDDFWDSSIGCVYFHTAYWDAYIYTPERVEKRIGDTYKTAESAKAAVKREYDRNLPFSNEPMGSVEENIFPGEAK